MAGAFPLVNELQDMVLAAIPTSQDLIKVTSNATPGFHYIFSIQSDASGNAAGMTYTTYLGSQIQSNEPYSLDQLKSGIVLLRKKGYDVVTLKLDSSFDPATGGTVTLRYLENGMSNHYKDFYMQVGKTPSGWQAYVDKDFLSHSQGTDPDQGMFPFTKIKMDKKTIFLVGLVGIRKIQTM